MAGFDDLPPEVRNMIFWFHRLRNYLRGIVAHRLIDPNYVEPESLEHMLRSWVGRTRRRLAPPPPKRRRIR